MSYTVIGLILIFIGGFLGLLIGQNSKKTFEGSILRFAEPIAWSVFLLGFLFIEYR